MIHVAFCVNDANGSYVRHTAATIASIFENTKDKVTVHLIHDETLTDENKDRLLEVEKNMIRL